MDTYRLEEVDDVWHRLSEDASVDVAPTNIPYRLAALLVVAKRARATEGELRAYMAKHEWSADVEELRAVGRRLANIRHAARAAHDSLALRVGRYARPWPSENAG